MKIIPDGDRLIMRVVDIGTGLSSGKGGVKMVLPDTAEKGKPIFGVVTAVGPHAEGVSEDDIVMVGRYAGREYRIDSVYFLLVRRTEIDGFLRLDEGDDDPRIERPTEDTRSAS